MAGVDMSAEFYFWFGFYALCLGLVSVLVIGIRMFRILRSLEAIFSTSLMRWEREAFSDQTSMKDT